MNSRYFEYNLFEKERLPLTNLASCLRGYDRFISAYNTSERVKQLFQSVEASQCHWIILPEYNISTSEHPTNAHSFAFESRDEAEIIIEYFDKHPLGTDASVCIDATGFLRPHLLFLLRYFYENDFKKVDFLYSEPLTYLEGKSTQFASSISDVRQVRGYEGTHYADTSDEFLIVGCGYDTDLMHAVNNNRKHATKVQLFPFPPLRPHMYQENRIRTQQCSMAFGNVLNQYFAPGYDPFATAQTLSHL